MSAPVRPWRPLSQLDLERIRNAAIEAFDAWLVRWIDRLPAGKTEAAYIAAARQLSRADALGWRLSDGIRLATSEGAMGKAALLALDLPGSDLSKDLDEVRAVTEPLRDAMAADLAASVAAAYAQTVTERLSTRLPEDRADALVLEVRRPGTNLELVLHVDRDWATSQPLDAPPARASSLATRTAALEDARVAVTAVVGHCRLTVMELAQLAVGDVVTCDTRVDALVGLSLVSPSGHSGPQLATAKPGRSGNRWALLVGDIERQKVGNER